MIFLRIFALCGSVLLLATYGAPDAQAIYLRPKSCAQEIGAEHAKTLVRQCNLTNPHGRLICQNTDSCARIAEEVETWCRFQRNTPDVCKNLPKPLPFGASTYGQPPSDVPDTVSANATPTDALSFREFFMGPMRISLEQTKLVEIAGQTNRRPREIVRTRVGSRPISYLCYRVGASQAIWFESSLSEGIVGVSFGDVAASVTDKTCPALSEEFRKFIRFPPISLGSDRATIVAALGKPKRDGALVAYRLDRDVWFKGVTHKEITMLTVRYADDKVAGFSISRLTI